MGPRSGTETGDINMSYQSLTIATSAVRNSQGLIGRLADRIGMIALLAMGLAMGGVTALAGL